MLEVSLTHAFGGFHLDTSFEAPPGITVLFGRSGSGKTTIVNAVAGLLKPDRGRIAANGQVLLDTANRICLPPHARRIGYIFQEGRLFPHLTVAQNLDYGRWFAPRGTAPADSARIIEMLGIGHLLTRYPARLSGGEKQRVAIGRALLCAPQLILADEPLASLDETRKAEILPYFERLRDEVSAPILYVSHAAAEVARLATTVVALQDGKVLRQGPAAQVLGDPSVTPTGAREAGAMVEARIAAHHDDGLTEVIAGSEHLLLPRLPQAVGSPVRIRIAAHDVILARSRPTGISALNVIPGTVHEIRMGEGPGALVAIDTSAGRVLSRITRRSVQALDIKPGSRLFAIIKAVAIAPVDIGR
jgi:molybdate transport system ATP-binding protein